MHGIRRNWLFLLAAATLAFWAAPSNAVVMWSDLGATLAHETGAGSDILSGALKRDDSCRDTLYFKFHVDPLSDVGIDLLRLALENVLERAHKELNVRHPLVESLGNINRNGLTVIASFVLGLDGERRGAGERIAAFVEATSIPLATLNILQSLPNTALWERLQREGRLRSLTTGDTTEPRINFVPSRPAALRSSTRASNRSNSVWRRVSISS